MNFRNIARCNDGHQKHAPSKNVIEAVESPLSQLHSTPLFNTEMVREIVSVLSAMQESERGAYDPSGKFAFHTEKSIHSNLHRENRTVVDERCRAKMLDWCSKMIDYFAIDRNIVAVAAYYQDRFLGTTMGKAARTNRSLFRVVSVTSLYIAIKLRVPHKWNVTSHAFAQLCQGSVSGDEINYMEIDILFALGWNVNPPIAMEYSEAFLDMIFNSVQSQGRISTSSHSEDDDSVLGDSFLPLDNCVRCRDVTGLKDHLHELVQYQLEIALHDHRLFQVRSSALATAAVLNALEGAMNESPSYQEGSRGTSFYQESIALVMTLASLCNISTEKELEYIREVLLISVVSPNEVSNASNDGPEIAHTSELDSSIENPPRSGSPTISSSPTSTAKFLSQTKSSNSLLTPHTVLSKVFTIQRFSGLVNH